MLVQPLMLFNPGKIAATSRLCWERGVALVVVGFPATPLLTARARICISASHTRKDLDYALEVRPHSVPARLHDCDMCLTRTFSTCHAILQSAYSQLLGVNTGHHR